MSDNGSGWLIVGLVGVLWWGAHEHRRANDEHTKLEVAQAQIADLKTKADALTAASDNLKEQVDRFQTEDWRDVVPAAKDAAEEADSAKDELQSSVDGADGG